MLFPKEQIHVYIHSLIPRQKVGERGGGGGGDNVE